MRVEMAMTDAKALAKKVGAAPDMSVGNAPIVLSRAAAVPVMSGPVDRTGATAVSVGVMAAREETPPEARVRVRVSATIVEPTEPIVESGALGGARKRPRAEGALFEVTPARRAALVRVQRQTAGSTRTVARAKIAGPVQVSIEAVRTSAVIVTSAEASIAIMTVREIVTALAIARGSVTAAGRAMVMIAAAATHPGAVTGPVADTGIEEVMATGGQIGTTGRRVRIVRVPPSFPMTFRKRIWTVRRGRGCAL